MKDGELETKKEKQRLNIEVRSQTVRKARQADDAEQSHSRVIEIIYIVISMTLVTGKSLKNYCC